MTTEWKNKPHRVYKITHKKTGGIRYSCNKVREDGTCNVQADTTRETVELVREYENFLAAHASRQSLARKSFLYMPEVPRLEAAGMAPMKTGLPEDPRTRRAFFLELDAEDQEQIVFHLALTTASPLKRICTWLMVHPDELADEVADIYDVARAELDMRLARNLITGGLNNTNTKEGIAKSIFLSKTFLGFHEQGQFDPERRQQIEEAGTTGLFGEVNALETHRDNDGRTVKEPTKLTLVKAA